MKEPIIRVIWEDYPENVTQERINRIKQTFQKKYNTRNVHVKVSSIINFDATKLSSLDITENISDFQYQKKLMNDFIRENNIITDTVMLNKIDDRINLGVQEKLVNKLKYNKWYIKNIHFSNFLSFGEDNFIDFDTLGGITVVESNPKNFGGKSTATIDLLLFLFFNKTSKTKTNIEVFNRYSSSDTVRVKGEIIIDDEDYFIERILTRKKTRSGDYKVSTDLNFFKIKDGVEVNLEGEQRRETENFISAAIGSIDDFLSTILTTGGNLEEMIESKATDRGRILTKFLGLENLEIKEEVAKKIYNEWSHGLTGKKWNAGQLETDIEELKLSAEDSKLITQKLKDETSAYEKSLGLMEVKKEKVLSSKNNDVDLELINTNPQRLQLEINDDENEIQKKRVIVSEINVVEPNKFYLEEEHQEVINKRNDKIVEGKSTASEITRNEELVKQLTEGTICPTCKRPLEDVNHDEEINSIKNNIETLKAKRISIGEDYKILDATEKEFLVTKKQFDEYERNKMLKAKYELEIERKEHEKTLKTERLGRYDTNKQKMVENQKIESDLLILNTQISTAKASIKQNDELVIKHSNNIVLVERSIAEKQELIKEIKKEEKIDAVYKIYLSIFGKNGISKEIVRNIIPLLNNELHNLLFDSAEFTVELRVNDKYEIEFAMIDNETRIEKPLESGSGYEKTIASLAIRSVLTKVSSLPKPNIIVMDEVFGKIADENLELVGMFFSKVKEYFDHVVVISHNPLIRNWSDNVIMVQKIDNISSIEFINTNVL